MRGGLKQEIYYESLKDAGFFKMLFAVHFALKGVLVELLKRHTRPAENELDPAINRLAWYAAGLGYKEIIRLLLTEKDVDWNKTLDGDIKGFDGRSLLLLIAELDTQETVRTLLHKEIDPVHLLMGGTGSALHWATRNRCTSIARKLLEAGADVGGIISEATPYLSDRESWEEMIDLLLEYQADINALSVHDYAALHIAANTSRFGTYAVEYLISKGADVNLPTCQRITPLNSPSKPNRKVIISMTGKWHARSYKSFEKLAEKRVKNWA